MHSTEMKTITTGNMVLMYYKDHDARYAHIPEEDRWQYPDEVQLGGSRHKREKNLDDIKMGEVPTAISALLLAKDIPISEACIKI